MDVRIVAGELKGRRIESPRGLDTRPTSNRVREALFSILGSNVVEARIVDLFAGVPWARASGYALAHLPRHLAQVPEMAGRLYELVSDPAWERAKRDRFGAPMEFSTTSISPSRGPGPRGPMAS